MELRERGEADRNVYQMILGCGCGSQVEHLLSMCEILGPTPCTTERDLVASECLQKNTLWA